MSRFALILALAGFTFLNTGVHAQVPNPLAQVLTRVQAEVAAGRKPIVVFDLDDTLFRVAYRTRSILRDWARQHPELPGMAARVDALEPVKMPWSLPATLDLLQIRDARLRKSADKFWGAGFFSNRYLGVDETIRGSVVYVNRLARAGARLIYLTGRDTERMYDGSYRQLLKFGFPLPAKDGHALMMKPDFRMKDYVYKEQACREINAIGPVVASIDNEPRNCNMFRAAFPGATIVCVDTPHSDNAPALDAGIPIVADYRF